MSVVLGVVMIVVVGLMVGVELAVAAFVNPIFDRLPADGGPAARSDGARVLGRVMPFWYVGSVVLGALWAAAEWGQPRTGLIVFAVLLLVLSVLMSVTLLVPINTRVAGWSAGTIPADWREQVGRWDRWHHVRVGVIIVAFAVLVLAGAR